jgi:hypothetical protein
MIRALLILLIVWSPVMAKPAGILAQEPESYRKTPEEAFGERIAQYLWEGNNRAAEAELQALDEWRARNGKAPPPAPPRPGRGIYDDNPRFNVLPPELSRK